MVNSSKWATGANSIPMVNSSKWATGANSMPVAKSTNSATGASKWATGANTIPVAKSRPIVKKEEVNNSVAVINSSKWTATKNDDNSSFTDSSYSESETEEEMRKINKGTTDSNCSNKDGSGTSQMVGYLIY